MEEFEIGQNHRGIWFVSDRRNLFIASWAEMTEEQAYLLAEIANRAYRDLLREDSPVTSDEEKLETAMNHAEETILETF